MEMCYDGALVMPKNYVVMNEEEMTYVEGGFTARQKALVAAAVVVAGVAACVALAYGQVWLVSAICRISFGQCVRQLGVSGVATIVGISLGISATAVGAGLSQIF